MGRLGFFLIVGVLFSIALYVAGYYVWSVPEQEAAERLGSRLRELRAHMRSRSAEGAGTAAPRASRTVRVPGRSGDLGRRAAAAAGP